MEDVSVVFQAHRVGHADQAHEMWVTSWHNYLDNHGVSRGKSFATEEEARACAVEMCGQFNPGYMLKGEDGASRFIEIPRTWSVDARVHAREDEHMPTDAEIMASYTPF